LGIQPLFALTPQAKGRVERLFATLQDRLVAELQLNAIRLIPAANHFIHHQFIARFNHHFQRPAADTTSAWRIPPPTCKLEQIICFRYPAVVANDNCIRLHGQLIDIPKGPGARSYAAARVEVRQRLDGAYLVFHQAHLIAATSPQPIREPIYSRARRKYTTQTQIVETTTYFNSLPN